MYEGQYYNNKENHQTMKFTASNMHATATMPTTMRLSDVLPLQLLHAGRYQQGERRKIDRNNLIKIKRWKQN